MITLRGRSIQKTVDLEIGKSILDHAKKNGVDFGFNCTRGTCARCRCFVAEGRELLNEPTDAEFDRMDEEEFEQGFRLGCQAVVRAEGEIRAVNRTYF